MKKSLRNLRPAVLISIGLVLAIAGAAAGHAGLAGNERGAAALMLQATVTPTPQDVSIPGSTDGIVLMGVIIVLIVLIPILLRRKSWSNK